MTYITGTDKVEQRILDVCLELHALGCNWLSDQLKLEGNISTIAIQKILYRNEMGSRYDRWIRLEEKYI